MPVEILGSILMDLLSVLFGKLIFYPPVAIAFQTAIHTPSLPRQDC
jgi:hypothetical protein